MMVFHQARHSATPRATQQGLRAQKIESAEHDDTAQYDERNRVLAEIEKGRGGPRRQAKGGDAFHAVLLVLSRLRLRVFPWIFFI